MKTRIQLILVLAATIGGPCCASETNTVFRVEQNLRAVWTTTNATVQQRAIAVNSYFTNGTPIRQVLGVLGKWDELHQRFLATDPSELDHRALVYRFGPDRITVRVKGKSNTRTEDCSFEGAFGWTPTDFGQQSGAASRSQLIRSETNRTSAAAGSGR